MAGLCTNEPSRRETCSGAAPEGGRELGGLAMFCEWRISGARKTLSNKAHKFEFSLAGRRDFDGLDALFARRGVEETQESLVRLDAVVGRLLRDLECELQGIARAQDDGVCAFLEGNPVGMFDSA